MHAHDLLDGLGVKGGNSALPSSTSRFADGTQYRIEISSVEGPSILEAVVDEAERLDVPIHRISQGSGIHLLTDGEITEMVAVGRDRDIEVNLFVGPRAGWEGSIQAVSLNGRAVASTLRGIDQLAHGTEDVMRAVSLGVRSVLVADLGHLMILGALRKQGHLPADLVLKTSVTLPVANPATARVLIDLGADTINLPVDLTLAMIADIRRNVRVPLDQYIESPDDLGGVMRYHEVPELVRVAAPIYLKFAVRNAPPIYPVGRHNLESTALLARERVRRARISLDFLARYLPTATCKSGTTPAGNNDEEPTWP